MGIEPLSSAMTFQAQTVQPAQAAPKAPAEYAEMPVRDVPRVDSTTAAVEKSSEGQPNGGGSEQLANDQSMHEKLKKAVDQMNKKVSNSEVLYGFHEATNRVTLKIIDKDSKEVIKELPPEKTLDMIAKVWEIAGLLVDERR